MYYNWCSTVMMMEILGFGSSFCSWSRFIRFSWKNLYKTVYYCFFFVSASVYFKWFWDWKSAWIHYSSMQIKHIDRINEVIERIETEKAIERVKKMRTTQTKAHPISTEIKINQNQIKRKKHAIHFTQRSQREWIKWSAVFRCRREAAAAEKKREKFK